MAKLTRLRAIRERAALSQRELAELAGITPVQVSRIERGDAEPYPATVRKLAAALKVQPADLMEPISRGKDAAA
jgi:transcriptional regulator with XRE-family HTH domain